MAGAAGKVWRFVRGRVPVVRALPVLFCWGYLALTASYYALPHGTGAVVPGVGWAAFVVALVAPLVWLAVGRARPAVVLVVLIGLLLAVRVPGWSPAVDVLHLLLMLAVGELAMRRRGRVVAVGYLLATVAMVISVSNLRLDQSPPVFFPTIGVLVAAPLVAGLYLRSVRTLATVADERSRELERQRDLVVSSVRAGERAAIARELHDLLAHHLSSIVMRVGAARHRRAHPVAGAAQGGDRDDELDEVLVDVHAAARTALEQMHQLLEVLRDPAAAGHDLAPLLGPADLQTALRAIVQRADPHTQLDMPETLRLDALRALAVLRVVQESLTNVAKHSPSGSRTTVTITQPATRPPGSIQPGPVQVQIRTTYPNSTGSRAPGQDAPGVRESGAGGGWGLVGMRERITVLGGQLSAGPISEGWCVRATLPDVPWPPTEPTPSEPIPSVVDS